jgi:hypothetical protein
MSYTVCATTQVMSESDGFGGDKFHPQPRTLSKFFSWRFRVERFVNVCIENNPATWLEAHCPARHTSRLFVLRTSLPVCSVGCAQ